MSRSNSRPAITHSSGRWYNESELRMVSTILMVIAVGGGLLFLLIYTTGQFDGSYGEQLFHLLYGFNAIIISSAVVLLALAALLYKDIVVGVVGLACCCWFLGSFYWTSFVWLGGNVLTYPSVAELSFQSFHILILIVGGLLLRETGEHGRKYLWGFALLLASTPAIIHFFVEMELTVLLVNTFQLFLIGLVTILGVKLLISRTYSLFGLALLMFSVADIGFHLTTLIDQAPVVMMLDPLWFSSHALIAVTMIRYAQAGELP